MSLLSKLKVCVRQTILRTTIFKNPSIRYCSSNDLFPSVLLKTPSESVRKLLNLPPFEHHSQLNQDIFALIVNRFRSGYFLEIGANDGFTFSNTLYLERFFGWSGILIEPNPRYIRSLKKRKNSIIVNKAITHKIGKTNFVDAGLYGGIESELCDTFSMHTKNAPKIIVDCISLDKVLKEADAPPTIDFVSIDVEGGELQIIEQIISVSQRFRCGCVECNTPDKSYKSILNLLNSGGYKIFWENQCDNELFFVDKKF